MTVMDRNLFSPLGLFFLSVFGIESIVSLLGNGFITLVSGHSWLRSKKMLPCDFLLTTLSLSRFLVQWGSTTTQCLYVIFPETFTHDNRWKASYFFWAYLNMASLWCATWLNVFYCLKVTNFAHPLFTWLKLRIGVLVPRLLGISLLTFIICSVPLVKKCLGDDKSLNLTENLSKNSNQTETHGINCIRIFNPLQICFTAFSFSICLMASIVLLVSLWRHRRNLKKSSLSTKDFSSQAHLSVMKSLLLSLFFYILHFAAMISTLAHVFKYGNLERLISEIVLSSYPSAHSIILIFTNPKLTKVCTHVPNLRRSAS